jgi:hypothetical protein
MQRLMQFHQSKRMVADIDHTICPSWKKHQDRKYFSGAAGYGDDSLLLDVVSVGKMNDEEVLAQRRVIFIKENGRSRPQAEDRYGKKNNTTPHYVPLCFGWKKATPVRILAKANSRYEF